MAAHNSLHRGESQPAPGELSGKKGVEDPDARLFIHAAAVVGDEQTHIAAGPEIEPAEARLGLFLVDRHCPYRHEDLTVLAADGFGRIDQQIHHHLLHLRDVGFDGGDGVVQIQFQVHVSGDGHLQQRLVLPHQFGETHRFHDEPSLAGIRQQLPGEFGGALTGANGIVHERRYRMKFGKHLQREAGVAHNADQEVIEIVRDASGEDAQAFEFRRFADLVVQPLAEGEIGDERRYAVASGVGVPSGPSLIRGIVIVERGFFSRAIRCNWMNISESRVTGNSSQRTFPSSSAGAFIPMAAATWFT